MSFQSELEDLIRKHSIDGQLVTPDFMKDRGQSNQERLDDSIN